MSDLFNLYVESGSPNGDTQPESAIRWAADEIITLRAQLEQERARLAELEKWVDDGSDAWRLRKQAEAVEAAKYQHALTARIPDGTSGDHFQEGFDAAAEQYDDALDAYAQRLRNQADEAEKGGK